ncbi:MAG: hypothetical protein IT303_04300 [Dehalococcoidia bacterium]|nr:hypothetical protein [Dehalococcoidia bacterium]
MTDRRPDRVYGILVRDRRAFVAAYPAGMGLPGGVFPPLADHRKNELTTLLYDQLGVWARSIWAQGAFEYQHPAEDQPWFSGFYTVWEWEGEPRPGTGQWLDEAAVLESGLPAPLRILLLSVLNTQVMRTT